MKYNWQESNAWWRQMAVRMVDGTATAADWDAADRRVWCMVSYYARNKPLGPDDIADIVQTVMWKLSQPRIQRRLAGMNSPDAMAEAAGLPGMGAPAHYVSVIVANKIEDFEREVRKQRRVKSGHKELSRGRPLLSPEAEVIRDEVCDRVNAALARLEDGDREVLTLFHLDGKPAWQIAVDLGITPNAVYQRLVRGRKRLREELDE